MLSLLLFFCILTCALSKPKFARWKTFRSKISLLLISFEHNCALCPSILYLSSDGQLLFQTFAANAAILRTSWSNYSIRLIYLLDSFEDLSIGNLILQSLLAQYLYRFVCLASWTFCWTLFFRKQKWRR